MNVRKRVKLERSVLSPGYCQNLLEVENTVQGKKACRNITIRYFYRSIIYLWQLNILCVNGKICMQPLIETLIEYHEQSVEDCRTIGNQKYNVLISLSVALASFIYALVSIYSALPTIQNIIYGGPDISKFPPIIINLAILILIIALLAFLFVYYSTITSFLFLVFHLPLMTEVSIKIEELQRDVLLNNLKDRYVDLFSWKGIFADSSEGERTKFVDYLQQYFILDDIKSVTISEEVRLDGNRLIRININFKFSSKDLKVTDLKHPIKLISGRQKSGTLCLDENKKIAILKIEGLELDCLNVKEKNGDFILYQSELKYRFQKVMPHFNVCRPSKTIMYNCLYIIVGVLLILGVICNYVLPLLSSYIK